MDDKQIMQKIGKLIRQERRHQEITMEALAKTLGVSYNAVQAWEFGRSNISVVRLLRVADALGVDPMDLLPRRDK